MAEVVYTYIVVFTDTIEKGKYCREGFHGLPEAEAFAAKCKEDNTFNGLYSIQNGVFERIDLDEYVGEYSVSWLFDDLPSEYQIDERDQEWKSSTGKVIGSYLLYSLIILVAITVSLLANYYSPYRIVPAIASCFATFFYSASTLGYLVTWKIQSLPGETPPENLNARFLIIGYVLGTVFTVLGLDIE